MTSACTELLAGAVLVRFMAAGKLTPEKCTKNLRNCREGSLRLLDCETFEFFIVIVLFQIIACPSLPDLRTL